MSRFLCLLIVAGLNGLGTALNESTRSRGGVRIASREEFGMLSEKIQDALNRQLNNEYASAYTYLSLAAYFEDLDLNGFAHWMKIQYHEELVHADKIYEFVNDRDGRVQLLALVAPKSDWT
jgi:hypothetical protein